ncbi:MAG: hypothetical protein C7B47_11895 [Sulfobacillus thermosulfidooxidans]|uniref:Uncharacterized protein n=1 Tax=Sulfobacillus thermosulfidooxidans TaxID=28034 RepID=A0A2T2WTL2_SULTH|nr:MAG: hypothetical protein C7B47_11895 [Sulfobacillus thermosulfidooxidans]
MLRRVMINPHRIFQHFFEINIGPDKASTLTRTRAFQTQHSRTLRIPLCWLLHKEAHGAWVCVYDNQCVFNLQVYAYFGVIYLADRKISYQSHP